MAHIGAKTKLLSARLCVRPKYAYLFGAGAEPEIR
jgi:hypothetical protein